MKAVEWDSDPAQFKEKPTSGIGIPLDYCGDSSFCAFSAKSRMRFPRSVSTQQQIQFQNLHVQDDKLFIRATAPSDDAKNQLWDQIKLVNPSMDDITADISVKAMGAAVGGASGQGGQTYTVKSGDNLSKISKQFYGNANEYMQIFYANRDQLNDPDKIQVGQELNIPAKS